MSVKKYKVIKDNLDEYSVLRPDNTIVSTEIQYKATAELFCDELNELNNENERLRLENEKLKLDANMLRVTIGRNEAYIDWLTNKSDWGTSSVRKGFDVWEQEPTSKTSQTVIVSAGNNPLKKKHDKIPSGARPHQLKKENGGK